jgi:hypothetical protein
MPKSPNKIYCCGNSLTWDSQPELYEVAIAALGCTEWQTGHHLLTGNSLRNNYDNTANVVPANADAIAFGTDHLAALAPASGHRWNAVQLQSYPAQGHVIEEDQSAFRDFATLISDASVPLFLYATWAPHVDMANWDQPYVVGTDTDADARKRDYYQQLYDLLAADPQIENSIGWIPAGEILFRLRTEMLASNMPLAGTNFDAEGADVGLYRDSQHLNEMGRACIHAAIIAIYTGCDVDAIDVLHLKGTADGFNTTLSDNDFTARFQEAAPFIQDVIDNDTRIAKTASPMSGTFLPKMGPGTLTPRSVQIAKYGMSTNSISVGNARTNFVPALTQDSNGSAFVPRWKMGRKRIIESLTPSYAFTDPFTAEYQVPNWNIRSINCNWTATDNDILGASVPHATFDIRFQNCLNFVGDLDDFKHATNRCQFDACAGLTGDTAGVQTTFVFGIPDTGVTVDLADLTAVTNTVSIKNTNATGDIGALTASTVNTEGCASVTGVLRAGTVINHTDSVLVTGDLETCKDTRSIIIDGCTGIDTYTYTSGDKFGENAASGNMNVQVQGSGLSPTDMDNLAIALDAGGRTNGTYFYTPGHTLGDAVPAAATAETNLTGKGWSVASVA